jgi:hypothetical protein
MSLESFIDCLSVQFHRSELHSFLAKIFEIGRLAVIFLHPALIQQKVCPPLVVFCIFISEERVRCRLNDLFLYSFPRLSPKL